MAGLGGGAAAALSEGRRSRSSTDGLERMLRMYIAQQCLGLSDEGIEDAIYDIQSVRNLLPST